MNRLRESVTLMAIIVLSLVISLCVSAAQEAPTCMMSIESDADLAALEGTTGQGTEDAPYIIEGLNIDAQGEGCCLRIKSTTSFFIIRNSTFTGASASAIYLENVHNGWISECVIEKNEVGVRLDAETSSMTFTLNTLRNNETDVIDHSQSTNWDDGYVGNWWDSYEGIDENGDGIGDIAYTFPLPDRQEMHGMDRFPLVEPFVGGEAPGPGKVRLEIKYNPGDTFELILSMRMHTEILMGFFPIESDMESDIVLTDEVTAATGYGIYDLQETVVEDTGRVTANGMAQPYDSSVGTITKPRIHRFGSMIDPGDTISIEESYGLEIPVQFPICYIGVGYTWNSEWTMGADALGVPEGEAIYKGIYTFDRFEEWNGKQCAVLIAHLDATIKGKEVDPLLGTTVYDGTLSGQATSFIDLSNGRTVKETGSLQMTINILSATGARLGKLSMEVTGEAADRLEIVEVEAPIPGEQLANLESQLEQIRADYLAQIAALQSQLKQVQDALATLEEESVAPLKIAYVNAEDAFSVFTNAVSDLRQKAADKQMEIAELQQDFMAGTISREEYQNSSNQLQAELLQAQLNIDIGTIDKMLASPGFSDMRRDLQRLRDEAQPVVDEMNNLVTTVRVGVIDTQEFENRYTQVKNAFTQLDQLLTQAATVKIVKAANKVALAEGYDLVLRVKNVIIYRNTAKIIDITDMVKHELASYL